MNNFEEVENITNLLLKEYNFSLSEQEKLILDNWKTANPEQAKRIELLLSEYELRKALKKIENADLQIRKKLFDAGVPMEEYSDQGIDELNGLKLIIADHQHQEVEPVYASSVRRINFLRTAWFRRAAAIVILFGVGAYIWNANNYKKPGAHIVTPATVNNDVLPGSNRAILTLSDGRKIELTAETKEISEAGTHIKNDEGKVSYGQNGQVVFNTMATPRGGQYQLVLADGTNVWLNAASSITYPTQFLNKTREVSITGEVYFEVAKNASKPFVVKTPKEQITVLGTQFNINAYTDEPVSKTSLLEGSVSVGGKVLKPGQAYIDGRVVSTNVENDVAWKNGFFNFEDANLKQVMLQLARWYDIEISYEGAPPEIKFKGSIDRGLTLSQVLNGLSKMDLKFRVEGRKLVISK
jgi:ferric-dicitrate binding protein FerR (iron transport regulator)